MGYNRLLTGICGGCCAWQGAWMQPCLQWEGFYLHVVFFTHNFSWSPGCIGAVHGVGVGDSCPHAWKGGDLDVHSQWKQLICLGGKSGNSVDGVEGSSSGCMGQCSPVFSVFYKDENRLSDSSHNTPPCLKWFVCRVLLSRGHCRSTHSLCLRPHLSPVPCSHHKGAAGQGQVCPTLLWGSCFSSLWLHMERKYWNFCFDLTSSDLIYKCCLAFRLSPVKKSFWFFSSPYSSHTQSHGLSFYLTQMCIFLQKKAKPLQRNFQPGNPGHCTAHCTPPFLLANLCL